MSTATAKIETSAPLRPIDAEGLAALSAKGKANPKNVVTLKARTVCEGRFRNLTFVRNLTAHVVDEPPTLLGDDTAPNPSEATLAALGSCLSVGIHANATQRGVTLSTIELELEGDLNVTAVWGVGDLSEKTLGFTDIRVKAHIEGDADQSELDAIVANAVKWSPVGATMTNPVNLEVSSE
ncbi:MAG: OsmC family protein [Rhodospirillales bacterium]|jgi:uncharacterized OsmC-like protein|nr:OsmC family protein [Rhodospirillales bacterium]